MEERTLRFPIGIQTFRDIIEGKYVYADKTGHVARLADTYRYVFLSRPRRFGKSLLSSTFHSYFAGEEELFQGLEAGRMNKDWRKHPVFHFDMSTSKHMSGISAISLTSTRNATGMIRKSPERMSTRDWKGLSWKRSE